MKKADGQRSKRIAALKRMKDQHIDLTDIPEKTDWSKAVVGKFYRPAKKPVTVRVGAGGRKASNK